MCEGRVWVDCDCVFVAYSTCQLDERRALFRMRKCTWCFDSAFGCLIVYSTLQVEAIACRAVEEHRRRAAEAKAAAEESEKAASSLRLAEAAAAQATAARDNEQVTHHQKTSEARAAGLACNDAHTLMSQTQRERTGCLSCCLCRCLLYPLPLAASAAAYCMYLCLVLPLLLLVSRCVTLRLRLSDPGLEDSVNRLPPVGLRPGLAGAAPELLLTLY